MLQKKRADPNLPIQKLLVLFQLGNQRISFLDDLQAQTLLQTPTEKIQTVARRWRTCQTTANTCLNIIWIGRHFVRFVYRIESLENIFRLGGRWIEGLLVNAELRLYWFWCFHGNDSNDEDGDKSPATHRITINSGLQVFVSAKSIRISHNCYWIPAQQQEKMKI